MVESSISQQVAKSSFYNLLTAIVGRGGALLFTFFLARLLLPAGFGIYSLALAIILFLQSLIELGTNSALLKYVPENIHNHGLAKAYFSRIFKIKLYLTGIASLIMLLLAYPLSNYIFNQPELFYLLLFSPIYLLVLSIEGTYSLLFYVFGDVKIVFFKEILSQFLRIGFLMLIPIFFARNFYLYQSFFSIITALLITAILVFFICFVKYAKLFSHTIVSSIDYQDLNKFIWYVSLGGLSAMFFSSIDVMLLGALIKDISYVGYYRAATTLVFSVAGLLTFTNILLPRIAQLPKSHLQSAWDKLMRYALFLTIPAVIGMIILGKYIIRAVYGYAFLDASWILYILAFVLIEAVLSGIAYSVLSARGKPESYTFASTIALGLSFILMPLSIYLFLPISYLAATLSASVAILFCRAVYLILLLSKVKSSLGLEVFKPRIILKPLISSALMGIVLVTLNSFFINDMTWFLGFLEVLLGIIIYFIALFLLGGITKEDIILFYPKNIV